MVVLMLTWGLGTVKVCDVTSLPPWSALAVTVKAGPGLQVKDCRKSELAGISKGCSQPETV
jgi:hypothetical protein